MPVEHTVFIGKGEETEVLKEAPIFVIENDVESYNLIGSPEARLDEEGKEIIFINPSRPAIYFQRREFQTDRGRYTNLIYRIHFEGVPFSLAPFYIGRGQNVGLFVVATLDSDGRPLLYTTVHTCGCYLAFIPTGYLEDEALPAGWNRGRQSVYGEKLPGIINLSDEAGERLRLFLLIRSGSHRVKDAWAGAMPGAAGGFVTRGSPLLPMTSLDELAIPGGARTSFFETVGPRKGYVKGSRKPLERLLMSWWALDWRIGEDKDLGKDKGDGVLFYTSLKPWARDESDMRDFGRFLKFWGWGL